MKGMPILGMILLALSALPVSAGTLYKCTGADGTPHYVSKRVGGARCEVISRYASDHRGDRLSRVSPPSVAASSPAMPSTRGTAAVGALQNPAQATAARMIQVSSSGTRRVVSGQVYFYIKDGVRHYSSSRPKAADAVASLRTIQYHVIETCYACGNPRLNFGNVGLNTAAYQAEISAASREFGVDEAVIRAIMHAESAYNPLALSHAGAQGLMQLMPATAGRFGVSNAYDAAQNIRGGVKYLSWLLKRFNGNLTLAAAGYNAGEGAVDRHGGVPPYRETQRYVERVGLLAQRYRSASAAR